MSIGKLNVDEIIVNPFDLHRPRRGRPTAAPIALTDLEMLRPAFVVKASR